MASTVQVGLVTTSANDGTVCTAVFNNVAVGSGTLAALAAPLTDRPLSTGERFIGTALLLTNPEELLA